MGSNKASSRGIELFLLLRMSFARCTSGRERCYILRILGIPTVVASTTVSAATQQVRRNLNHAVKYLFSETARSTNCY